MALMEMKHDVDPKQALLDALGDLSNVEIAANKVLVAVYIRPNKTKSGIILTDNTVAEDKWQGKVGLIVKTGPLAFEALDPSDLRFHGITFGLHDWVFFRSSDGMSTTVKGIGGHRDGVLCRIISDDKIIGKAASCDDVW